MEFGEITYLLPAIDGDVGFGVEEPTTELDIRGGSFGNNQEIGINLGVPDGQWMSGMFLRSNSGGVPRLAFDVPVDAAGATDEKLCVNNLGDVGIGTSSPTAKLAVEGSGDATSTNVVPSEYTAQIYTDSTFLNLGSVSGKPCIQSSGTGTSYTLLLNPFQGKVGIGQTRPMKSCTLLETSKPTTLTSAVSLKIVTSEKM